MNINCPYCGHGMGLKDVKPGKYKPKCNKCEQRFLLTVPTNVGEGTVVARIEGAQTTNAGAENTHAPAKKTSGFDATMAQSSPAPAASPMPPQPAQKTVAGASVPFIPKPSKREVTRSDQIDATAVPRSAKHDDATATPPAAAHFSAPEMSSGTEVAMEATTIDPRPKANTIPEILGGYKLIRELGRGAMGAVYMAKQLSLDRNVALKLIQAKWASNPVFIARFTREAYAAAQLTHHNVVQIYDLGCQNDINYYTMEFVSGQSLAQLVQKQGKLDAEAAVGYILQAARGLNFAHLQGMVHRDVKPANLMLNEQGVVKVADMGLVKTPHLIEDSSPDATMALGPSGSGSSVGGGSSLSAATAEVTMANIAMGTPAYMAPEQAANAAGVDHRADIYSLGCTLYVLLTGRPPFEGASALEVITKHRTEPIMRPEAIVKRIPPELSNIVLKMVAKRPEDRFQTMGEVIRTLEHFLGVQSTGPFSPREEHAQTLENCLAKFNNAPLAKIRNLAIPGFLVASVGLSAVLLFVSWWWLSAVLGMTVGAILAYFVTGGTSTHNYFFDKIRSYIFSQTIGEWITNIGSILLGAAIVWLLGWTVPFVSGAVVGACLGAACSFVIDKRLLASRRESIEAMESLLKSLRMKGVEEDAIEQFVVKYSGDQWEEFYETIFGYEAMFRARSELSRSEQGRRRHKYATWRDGIIKSIDAKLAAQREARDRKHLQKVEEDNLKAQGIDASRAKEEAAAMAAAQVEAAAEVRALPTEKTQTALNLDDPRLIAAQKRDRQLQMLAEARGGKRRQEQGENFLIATLRGPMAFLLGAKVRFLIGAALMAAFIYWLNINGILGELDKTVSSGIEESTQEAAEKVATSIFNKFYNVMLDPNKLQPLPFPVIGGLLSHFGTGVAGLSLLILGLFPSWRVSFFALPAAASALIVIAIMPSMMLIGYGIAAGLTVAGVLIGRNME